MTTNFRIVKACLLLACGLPVHIGLGTRIAVADELGISEPVFAKKRAERRIEEPPDRGIFYNAYEPTFYTGFAPRTQDPRRIHLHVGRGNQLRVTQLLSDDVVDGYARDLEIRRQTYRELVKGERIRLSQNDGLTPFDARLEAVGLSELVKKEGRLSPEDLRDRNLGLMERLNPGRVFRIDMPADEIIQRWISRLGPEDRGAIGRDRRLELINLLLPTRFWVTETKPAVGKALASLIAEAHELEGEAAARPGFESAFWDFFDLVSDGLYPRTGGRLRFAEFTALYPIGTFNDYTEFQGHQIPFYPTPGRRAFTTHQRTHTVDHIPTIVAYSYAPWLPYMHVGSNMHNSFHTLWWPMEVSRTDFLPETWVERADEGFEGTRYHYVWVLSRGPMSSGCTHLNNGHILELRQLLPAETDKLYSIDVFLNRSYDYDVFDIDGDFTPEVMGVKYFIAYSLRNKRPGELRVRDEREGYYSWLYSGDLEYDEDGSGHFAEVQSGRFVERSARKGPIYRDIALYEAEYQPQLIQFYRPADIPFARELRKVGLDHSFQEQGP